MINQFAAGNNPRYAHQNGSTYCNIFAWDVTRAMGAEIPHWVDASGNPTVLKGNELNANAVNEWLHQHGARFGWRKTTLSDAVDQANQGCPVVASWSQRRRHRPHRGDSPRHRHRRRGPVDGAGRSDQRQLHPHVQGLEKVGERRAVGPRVSQ